MSAYFAIPISDLKERQGASFVSALVDGFECAKNAEVETFLKRKASSFAKQDISVTHLAFNGGGKSFVGYFTLAHKPLSVAAGQLSGTQRRRLSRFAVRDEATDSYQLSAFLIAQLGRNFAVPGNEAISGDELLQMAFDVLAMSQRQIGGQVVFLECEEGNGKLLDFYRRNGFVPFGVRESKSDRQTYAQLFAFLH